MNFIYKIFIRNHENIEKNREKYGIVAGGIGIVLNISRFQK